MKCRDAHLALLEADLAALQGVERGDLSDHLSTCPDCRARAEAILHGESLLAEGLEGVLHLPDLDEIIHRAEEGRERVLPFPKRFGRWGIAALPVAAAAALAALFLGRPPSLPGPELALRQASGEFSVEAPEGQGVVVMETSNPDIKVVWLF